MGDGARARARESGACYICGSKEHKQRDCPDRDKQTAGGKERLSFAEWKAQLKCSMCGKNGDTADYCPDNKNGKHAVNAGKAGNVGAKGIRSVKSVDAKEEDGSEEDSDGSVMGIGGSKDDFEVEAYIYGMPISSLVDTGADWCCMGKETYKKLQGKHMRNSLNKNGKH